MAAKRHGRSKSRPKGRRPAAAGSQSPATDAADPVRLTVRKLPDHDAWELVPARCAQRRGDDLAEVRAMLEAGELDVARDECRWLLEGCGECLEAHRLLGEIALEQGDTALARGHFGIAYRLGLSALQRAGARGPLPYRLEANQPFFESAKGLAWCLLQLGKRDMAAEVVAAALACDPSDPLNIGALMADPE